MQVRMVRGQINVLVHHLDGIVKGSKAQGAILGGTSALGLAPYFVGLA